MVANTKRKKRKDSAEVRASAPLVRENVAPQTKATSKRSTKAGSDRAWRLSARVNFCYSLAPCNES
jgi:BRCT domain type II-containing protein